MLDVQCVLLRLPHSQCGNSEGYDRKFWDTGNLANLFFFFFFFEYAAVCLCHPEVFLRHCHHRLWITSQKRSADSVLRAFSGCENDPRDARAGDKHLPPT